MCFFSFCHSIFLIKKMESVRSYIDFKNVAKLVQIENQRKKMLWERKSKKLLIAIIVLFLMIILFIE